MDQNPWEVESRIFSKRAPVRLSWASASLRGGDIELYGDEPVVLALGILQGGNRRVREIALVAPCLGYGILHDS